MGLGLGLGSGLGLGQGWRRLMLGDRVDERVARLRVPDEERAHARRERTHKVAREQQQSDEAACMVKRGENGDVGGLWLEGHGHSTGSDASGLSPRVRRAASRLCLRPEEPMVAGYGAAKTPL